DHPFASSGDGEDARSPVDREEGLGLAQVALEGRAPEPSLEVAKRAHRRRRQRELEVDRRPPLDERGMAVARRVATGVELTLRVDADPVLGEALGIQERDR